MDKLQFRILLCTSFLLTLIGGLYDLVFPSEIFEKVQKYIYEIEPALSPFQENIALLFGLSVLAIGLVSIVGLFFFKNWARHLYLSCFILAIPVYLVSGVTAYSSISKLLIDLSGYCAGAILVVCYSPSLKFLFEARIQQGN